MCSEVEIPRLTSLMYRAYSDKFARSKGHIGSRRAGSWKKLGYADLDRRKLPIEVAFPHADAPVIGMAAGTRVNSRCSTVR